MKVALQPMPSALAILKDETELVLGTKRVKGISRNIAYGFPLVTVTISSVDWNLRPLSHSFKRGERKKSHGERSGEYGGCEKTTTCCSVNSCWTSTD